MTNSELIEEILIEADEYGLRDEVIETAAKIRKQDPSIEAVDSYQIAFKEWIK